MIELFDTHCHFEREEDIAPQLARARAAGVTRLMAVGGSPALNATAYAAAGCGAEPRPLCALGWDREQAGDPKDGAPPRTPLGDPRIPLADAIGEIGLDYYYSPETRDAQRALFEAQLERARELDKPVVIHTRGADEDTLAALKRIPSRGIIHCFTGEPGFCRALLDLGFMISISGIVTFRKADNVRESALVVPDDRILIETDSPYLAPVPMRGSPNEPAFLVHTARFLAALRQTPFEDFARLTTENAIRTLCPSSSSS